MFSSFFFFFNHPSTPVIYTLSLHDALPILGTRSTTRTSCTARRNGNNCSVHIGGPTARITGRCCFPRTTSDTCPEDRKSTRLNSSHQIISYAVFCLKKKNY